MQEDETVASVRLAPQPVRRNREHWIARLPNFLEFSTGAFNEHIWDPTEAETSGQGRIVDPGLRSLMKTNNTIRWRWKEEEEEEDEGSSSSRAKVSASMLPLL